MNNLMFSEFFFLHPLWLLGSMISVVTLYFFNKQKQSKSSWWDLMDNHIGHSLIKTHGSHKFLTPMNVLLGLLTLICFAFAGPSFDKQIPEQIKDKASVIVLLANGDSMYAGDISPNRNRLAKRKIKELQQAMPGSQFGIITFAHTAHQVTPLSVDHRFVNLYLQPIEPSLMPDRQLKRRGIQDALVHANVMITKAIFPVNIVLLTDKLTDLDVKDLIAFKQQNNSAIQVIAMGTESGGALRFHEEKASKTQPDTRMNLATFTTLKQLQFPVLGVTQNNTDIDWLTQQIKQSVAVTNNQNAAYNWQDSGYLLAWLCLPLCLWLFRKQSWVLSLVPVLPLLLVSSLATSSTAIAASIATSEEQPIISEPSLWQKLWFSFDQLGQKALDKQDFYTASVLFKDPYLKGWSLYQLGDFTGAEQQFDKVKTAEGYFYLANSLAKQEKYKQALLAYGNALKIAPDFNEAKVNAQLVKTLMANANKVNANKRQVNDQGQIMLQVGNKAQPPKKHQQYIDPVKYSVQELQAWLDKVESSPEALLKTKFELQSQRKMIDEL